MKKLIAIAIAKFVLLCALGLITHTARAQGQYLDVTLQGSFGSTTYETYTTVRQSLGVEIGIPISDYFELSLGHGVINEKTTYTEEKKQELKAYGYSVPEGKLETVTQSVDTTVNGGLGFMLGRFYPSIFAGGLFRRYRNDTFFYDEGTKKKNTWNAGIAVGVFLTNRLKFKLSHRLSPSMEKQPGQEKQSYDHLTSTGLTWSL